MTRRVALVLEYEGTAFAGFQWQPNVRSVQGELEDAIANLTGSRPRVAGAGRTDAGTHASGQVAAFDTESALDLDRIRSGLNHHLPADMAVRSAYDAPADFDPRRHAVARVYRYTFVEGRGRSPLRWRTTCPVHRTLDVAAMAQALAHLEGERDFAPFSGPIADGKSTVRRMERAYVWRGDVDAADEVYVELKANAFLPQQVRRTAAAARDVGMGALTVAAFQALADSGRRGAAEGVLPAAGLCLKQVEYDDSRRLPGAAADRSRKAVAG